MLTFLAYLGLSMLVWLVLYALTRAPIFSGLVGGVITLIIMSSCR